MKTFIYCSLFFTLSFGIKAQSHFVQGYIIEHDGDTLRGLIDERGDKLMSSICSFKANKKSEIQEYYPQDIAAYRLLLGKYYVAKAIEDSFYFFEYLINGELDIYYIRTENTDKYYIEKEGEGLILLPYQEKIIYRNEVAYQYKSDKHKLILNNYTEEAPQLADDIETLSQPNHKGLIKLAKSYHEAVCFDGEECIIYERKLPLFKINPELIYGVYQSNNPEILLDNQFNQYGILLHIWLPRSNEKLFFKTGYIRLNSNLEGEEIKIYKIPIQIEYVFPKWFIRPTLAYGINYYFPIGLSNAVNFGVQLEVTKHLKLRLNTEIEFQPSFMGFIPEKYAMHGYNLGLYINF